MAPPLSLAELLMNLMLAPASMEKLEIISSSAPPLFSAELLKKVTCTPADMVKWDKSSDIAPSKFWWFCIKILVAGPDIVIELESECMVEAAITEFPVILMLQLLILIAKLLK